MKMMKGLEYLSKKKGVKVLGVFGLQKTRFRATSPVFINFVQGCEERRQRKTLLRDAQLQDSGPWAQTEILETPFKHKEKNPKHFYCECD